MSQENSVKIDVGLSAKAEVKAEVPASSMGRLVDALTDIIRPFSEARGLRSDLIRLQREDVMIEIARRAQARLALEGLSPQPVPNKILIPLMEKSSWTDPTDMDLIDAWANLLSHTSARANPNHGIALDILSKLDSSHIKLLNATVTKPAGRPFEDVPLDFDEASIVERIVATLEEAKKIDNQDSIEYIENSINEILDVKGIIYTGSGLYVNNDDIYEFDGDGLSDHTQNIPDALVSLNILAESYIRSVNVGGYDIWVHYYSLTSFGVQFVEACTPHRQQSARP